MKNHMKKLILTFVLLPLLVIGCDSLFDTGDTEASYDGPTQLGFFPLENNFRTIQRTGSLQVQLIGPQRDSDLVVQFGFDTTDTDLTYAELGTHFEIVEKFASRPEFNVTTGSYDGPVEVEIKSSIVDRGFDATIYYTKDGSTPGVGSTVYSGPFPVSESKTVKAVVVPGDQDHANYRTSMVSAIDLNIESTALRAPVFPVQTGTTDANLSVAIAHSNADSDDSAVRIHFTRSSAAAPVPDDPTPASPVFNNPFNATLNPPTAPTANDAKTEIVKAIAVRYGLDEDGNIDASNVLEVSAMSEVEYTLDPLAAGVITGTDATQTLIPSSGSTSNVRIRFIRQNVDAGEEYRALFELQPAGGLEPAPNLRTSTMFLTQ